VVVLHVQPGRQEMLIPFARGRGIDVIDCSDWFRAGDIVAGEVSPPGQRAHAAYGTCVADALAGNRVAGP
jgi:hypothetical protein